MPMKECTFERPLCVIDQCSIGCLSRIDLESMKLIRWVTRCFRTYVPENLYKQTLSTLRSPETKELLESEIKRKRIIVIKAPEECCTIVNRENSRGTYVKADEGELECAALALKLSREYPTACIYLLTDDLNARSILSFIFQKQQIGTVFSSFDFLIYLYAHEKLIGKKWAQKTLRDLQLEMSSGMKKRIYIWPQEYGNFLQEVCRWRCGKCYLSW